MAIKSLKPRRARAIIDCGRPTYLVSQNKRIRIWHQRLTHASNARVVRASKLTDGINFDISNSKYDPAEVFIDSDNSNASNFDFNSKTLTSNNPTTLDPIPIIVACQENNAENPDNLDKLYTPYMGSISTRVVRQNKSITITTSKLEEVHINLWGLHNPLSHFRNTYLTIFICKYTWEIQTLYL